MKTVLHLIAFVFFMTSSISAQETTWKTYTTEAYEVKYPETWEFKILENSMLDFVVLCPLESEDDKLRENINLVKEGAQDLSINEYAESSIKMIELTFQKLKIISVKDITVNNIKMKKLNYTAKFGDDLLYFSQLYGIKDNIVYILTFTTEKKKEKKFKVSENEIMANFKLISE